MLKLITPEQVGLSTQRLERIRPWIQRYIDAGQLPGAQILVARNGKIAFFDPIGTAPVENGLKQGVGIIDRH